MNYCPVNSSDVFCELDQAHNHLLQFSKQNNQFAAYIKEQLVMQMRMLSSTLRKKLIERNRPLFVESDNLYENIPLTRDLEKLFSIILIYCLKYPANLLHISEKDYPTQTMFVRPSTIENILFLHDAILIDMNILQSIYQHLHYKTIFVCAGYVHIHSTEKALEQLGYKKIDHYGSEVQFKHLNDTGYAIPVDIANYFEKNKNFTHLNFEKEKKETPMQDICAVCGKTGAKYRCGNCKQVDYCSSDCQRKDWTNHKKVCKKK